MSAWGGAIRTHASGRIIASAAALFATLTLSLLSQLVSADTVIMQNGDRLSGEVKRQEGGKLLIHIAYAGTIAIDWAQVREVELDDPVDVLLDDERVVTVAEVTRADGRLRLQPPDVPQPMTVPPDAVELIEPEPWETGKGGKLSGRINLAFENENGNSPSTELDIDLTLSYRRRFSLFESFGQLEYDTTDGERSTDKWVLNNKYARFFPDTPWYGAAWLRLKNDRFADVRLRTIAASALGYAFGTGGTQLSVELGPAYLNEDHYVSPNASYWGPGVFVELEQALFRDRLTFYLKGMGFSSLSDGDKELWVSRTGFRVPLLAGFIGSIEYEIDHDHPPAEGAKATDETLRLLLGYEW
jgi:putative salt-induced outer membrane protein YdiY